MQEKGLWNSCKLCAFYDLVVGALEKAGEESNCGSYHSSQDRKALEFCFGERKRLF